MEQDPIVRQIWYNLFEKSLHELFDAKTVMKGKEYWEFGHVLEVYMNGLEITARVSGSYLPEYKVTIDLRPGRRLLLNTCTCPVASDCKHVVATILAIRSKWRPSIEHHLQKLVNNPLGLTLKEIGAIREHQLEIHEKLCAFYDKRGKNQFISDILEFFGENPHIFPQFVAFLGRTTALPSAKSSISLLEATNVRLVSLLDKFVEDLKIIYGSEEAYQYFEYKEEDTFRLISEELLASFGEIRKELSKCRHLPLREMWPLWNRIFLWWTNTIYRTIHSLVEEMDIISFEDLASLIYLPLEAFLLDFFSSCWQNNEKLESTLIKDIITALDELEARYPNEVDPNWRIAILLAFKINKVPIQHLKDLFPSEELKKDIEYVETEPLEHILTLLSDLFTTSTTLEAYLRLLKKHPQYGKDKEIQYQIIVNALYRDWYEFNDLFVELFELKDLKKDEELLKDLLRLYKRTHSLEIIHETLTRIGMTGDSELKELATAKFIKAAKKLEPMEYIRVLIACNQKQKAATVFYNKIYPRFMKTPTFALFSEAFLVEILPQIMEYNPNKTENLLSTLIEVHISRKNRVDYKMAAILARLLKNLYIEVKKNEQLWKNYIADLLQRHRRLSALKAEMRSILGELE